MIVNPVRVTVAPPLIFITLTALLPLRVMLSPVASVVTSSVMSNVLARLIVPVTLKVIVSGPAFAFAFRMA